MRIRSAILGFGLVSLALAGVVPQSQPENLDENGNTHALDRPDIKNPVTEHWKHLKNLTTHKHTGENTENLIPKGQEHPEHHAHPHHDHQTAKNHSVPHQTKGNSSHNAQSATVSRKTNKEATGMHIAEIHGRGEQIKVENQDKLLKTELSMHSSVVTRKPSTTSAAHNPSNSNLGSGIHLPVVLSKSSTKTQVHKSSSSKLKHTSVSATKPTSNVGGHQPSTSKAGSISKDKGIEASPNKQISSTNILKPDPASLGPQSKNFLKGPYGPIFDINNVSRSGHTGDQIDPGQKQLWDQQGAAHNRGLPPGSKLHLQARRNVQCLSDGDTPVAENECQIFDNSAGDTDEHPALETGSTTKIAPRQTLWSRFSSLVKRVTIGGQSSITGIIPQYDEPISFESYMVFNGQPGMIWLKEKGDITYCPTDDHHNIIGDYKVYLPSIFFTDTSNRKRCGEPCFLFWVSANGPMFENKIEVGQPNFERVLIAGQCNDCYPWEIQAEGAVIDLIAGNLTVDWNQGLWGPTLALGTNENFYKGNSDL